MAESWGQPARAGVWVSACLVCCALLSAGVSAGAGVGVIQAEVTVRLINQHDELQPVLGLAQAAAEGLYRRAGVRIRWVGGQPQDGHAAFTVVISAAATSPVARSVTPDVLGMAMPGDGRTRGTLARVFGDRVAAFATAQGLHLGSLLGCVIAHELGHLLLPLNAHASVGIMQPVWRARALPPHAPGVPGFLPWQADLLRQRVGPSAPVSASSN